jgi:hypothetical protein
VVPNKKDQRQSDKKLSQEHGELGLSKSPKELVLALCIDYQQSLL